MLDKRIASYYNIDSDIHRVNPLIKIISLFLYALLFLIVNNLVFSFAMLLFSLILMVLSKVPYKLYMYRAIPIMILCLFLLILNLIIDFNGITLVLKILSLSIYYSSYIYTTKIVDTNKGLYDILKAIDLYNYRIISFLLISIHFIQIIFLEYFNTLKIQKNRSSKDINFFNTFIYSIIKVKDKLNKINNAYKIKEFNFKFKYKTNLLVDYSLFTAHILLFFVYFLGKI